MSQAPQSVQGVPQRGFFAWPWRKAVWGLLAAIVLLFVLAYALSAFLLESVLREQLGKALGRDVTIERVSLNPWQGAIHLQGLSVAGEDGAKQLHVQALDVDFSWHSLSQKTVLIDALRIQAPRLQLKRFKDGELDIADVLQRWTQPEQAAPKTTPHFLARQIEVVDGQVHFEDEKAGVKHSAEAIALALPFISNLPADANTWLEPRLSAKVNGAAVQLSGKAQAFSATRSGHFQLDAQGLDLARLQPYWPSDLPVRPNAGRLTTQLHLDLKQAPEAPLVLGLQGTGQLSQLVLTQGAQAAQGAWLNLGQLELTIEPSAPLAGRWSLSQWAAEDLRVQADTGIAPWRVQRLAGKQLRLDVPARRLDLAQLQGQGLHTHLVRTPQQSWRWLALPGLGPSTPDHKPSSSAPSPSRPAAAWSVRVAALDLSEVNTRFEDQAVTPALSQELTHMRLSAQNLVWPQAPGQAIPVQWAATVNQSGQVQAQGTVSLQPLALRLALQTKSIALAPVQGYLQPYLNIAVKQGFVSSDGQLEVVQQMKLPVEGQHPLAPQVTRLHTRYQGQARLNDFHALEREGPGDSFKWKGLLVSGIDYQSAPARLDVAQVHLSDFYARLILDAQGNINLSSILRSPTAPDAAKPKRESERERQPTDAKTEPSLPINIAKMVFQNGHVQFTDRFIQPNYSADIKQVNGQMLNLSSAPGSAASLEVEGKYAGHAPVRLSGTLNPLSAQKSLDLNVQVSSIDLVNFSPYAGKYAGYEIKRGKLSLNASYKIVGRQLLAENKMFIDQLTFGNKVDSPQATDLPVLLAIALLKNNRGEIEINLPISGSLDDPQFSIRDLIFKTLGNSIVRALSSPLTFLSKLFGKGEELSSVTFAPGSADLDEAAVQQLQTLAKALRERQSLRLDVTGLADALLDTEALQRQALPDPSKPAAPSAQATAQATAQPTTQAATPPDITHEALQALANNRAQNVQTWMIEQGQVPVSRVFLLPAQVRPGASPLPDGNRAAKAPAVSHRVDFSLR